MTLHEYVSIDWLIARLIYWLIYLLTFGVRA